MTRPHRKNRTGCKMTPGYLVTHESDERIREVCRTRSPAQLEREAREREEDERTTALLRQARIEAQS